MAVAVVVEEGDWEWGLENRVVVRRLASACGRDRGNGGEAA
jgi:hypothetical protein